MRSREEKFDRLLHDTWDLVVIGGGATGLGAALDACSRGLRTLLLERADFAHATSSRSTKLIHGGVRYLRQGNLALVRESLQERGLLLQNAAGIVRPLEFVIPVSSHLETAIYYAGMKTYDLLAGSQNLGGSRLLSRAQLKTLQPGLNIDSLRGGVGYFDAQFDDAALALAVAQTCERQGGTLLNYTSVAALIKQQGKIAGVMARDEETGRTWEIPARAVINCTGIFTDELRQLDEPQPRPMLQLSQGIHLVLDKSFLPGSAAIIVPKTEDGRVIFLIPWQGVVLVGTTDTPANSPELEPLPRPEEVDYLLAYAAKYLTRAPQRSDILSCFAGLRPLARDPQRKKTSQLPRDHVISVSDSGLISIAGGKWTTFRRMGADAVARAIAATGMAAQPSATSRLRLTLDAKTPASPPKSGELSEEMIRSAARHGMARTVDDVLARRTRLLLTNAREAARAAPRVAEVLANELGHAPDWAHQQSESFTALARSYLPTT